MKTVVSSRKKERAPSRRSFRLRASDNVADAGTATTTTYENNNRSDSVTLPSIVAEMQSTSTGQETLKVQIKKRKPSRKSAKVHDSDNVACPVTVIDKINDQSDSAAVPSTTAAKQPSSRQKQKTKKSTTVHGDDNVACSVTVTDEIYEQEDYATIPSTSAATQPSTKQETKKRKRSRKLAKLHGNDNVDCSVPVTDEINHQSYSAVILSTTSATQPPTKQKTNKRKPSRKSARVHGSDNGACSVTVIGEINAQSDSTAIISTTTATQPSTKQETKKRKRSRNLAKLHDNDNVDWSVPVTDEINDQSGSAAMLSTTSATQPSTKQETRKRKKRSRKSNVHSSDNGAFSVTITDEINAQSSLETLPSPAAATQPSTKLATKQSKRSRKSARQHADGGIKSHLPTVTFETTGRDDSILSPTTTADTELPTEQENLQTTFDDTVKDVTKFDGETLEEVTYPPPSPPEAYNMDHACPFKIMRLYAGSGNISFKEDSQHQDYRNPKGRRTRPNAALQHGDGNGNKFEPSKPDANLVDSRKGFKSTSTKKRRIVIQSHSHCNPRGGEESPIIEARKNDNHDTCGPVKTDVPAENVSTSDAVDRK